MAIVAAVSFPVFVPLRFVADIAPVNVAPERLAFTASKFSKDDCAFVQRFPDCATVIEEAGNDPLAVATVVTAAFLMSAISLITEYLHPTS